MFAAVLCAIQQQLCSPVSGTSMRPDQHPGLKQADSACLAACVGPRRHILTPETRLYLLMLVARADLGVTGSLGSLRRQWLHCNSNLTLVCHLRLICHVGLLCCAVLWCAVLCCVLGTMVWAWLPRRLV